MPQRLYKILEPVLTRCLSLWVKPDVLPANPVQLIDRELPVLYVLEVGGLADRAALKLICQQFDLPNPAAVLRYGGITESSSVDVLKQRRGLIFRRHRHVISPRLQRLVTAALAKDAGELQIVPVAVYWGRAPEREASVFRLWFIENWNVAGRTRKLFTTLLHGRHTLLRISEPLSLQTLMAAKEPPEILQRKLSRVLRVHFRHRRIASLGPDQSHRRMLVGHVLADAGVRHAIALQADGKSIARFERRAERYALEIAADVSYPAVRILNRALTRLWTELYEGVELSGIERLQAVADGHEIVYVPCHRSHVDYLLLSYVLYTQGYSIPHVAAGINLNMPLIGGLLRRGGAFFLRRTFSGNKLYAAVFSAYLKEILQRGHALEYFVEGGRSRTGRLLPPKAGMLAMTVHAYLRNPRHSVIFIPVYFGYERLLEGRAFISELAGGKKQKESVFALLKSLRTLRQNYGHVYVNIGRPIALDELLHKHRENWREDNVDAVRPAWITPVVDELGTSIMQCINQAATVTPISLLATALLATPHGRLGRHELVEQFKVYYRLLKATYADSTVEIPIIDPDDVIEHGIELKFIELLTNKSDQVGQLVALRPGQAAPVTYFRNNIVHLLALPSLIACCFTNNRYREDERIQTPVLLAYPFFQAELFLAETQSQEKLEQALQAMAETGLIKREDAGWRRAKAGSIEAVCLLRLAQTAMPTLERYYMTAALLANAPGAGISEAQLAERCQACAWRLAQTHGRKMGDLHDKYLFRIDIELMIEKQFIDRREIEDGDDLLTPNRSLFSIETQARALLEEQLRHAILNAAQLYRENKTPDYSPEL